MQQNAGERDRFRGGWWRTFVTDALGVLPEVEAPPRGASKWEVTDAEA